MFPASSRRPRRATLAIFAGAALFSCAANRGNYAPAADTTIIPPVPELGEAQRAEALAVYTFSARAPGGIGFRPDAAGISDAFADALRTSGLFARVERVRETVDPSSARAGLRCGDRELALVGTISKHEALTDGLPFFPSYGYGTLLGSASLLRCADGEVLAEVPGLHARFEARGTLAPGLRSSAVSLAAVELVSRLDEELAGRTVASTGPSIEGTSSSRTPSREPTGPLSFVPQRPQDYQPFYGRRVAAVIGINDYQHWPALEGARDDARRMAVMLRQLGFNEVIELYDEKATRRGILHLLGRELQDRTRDEDLAVIFFAGHGQTETLPNGQKRGYIIPVDGDTRDVFSTAISMDVLRDLSNRLPAKHVYYAMDSCYSGLGFVRGLSVTRPGDGYLKKVTSRRAVQMITAGAEGEEAIEVGGQGLFTARLLAALGGDADLNGDGAVTASEIGAFIRPQVSSDSRHRQVPQFGTLEGNGEVVFLLRRP